MSEGAPTEKRVFVQIITNHFTREGKRNDHKRTAIAVRRTFELTQDPSSLGEHMSATVLRIAAAFKLAHQTIQERSVPGPNQSQANLVRRKRTAAVRL
jgi:hypothetical protein